MALGQALQGLERTEHAQESGLGKLHGVIGREGGHDEAPHAPAVKVRDILMSVTLARAQGKEEGGLGKGQRAAVGKQPVNLRLGPAEALCTCQCGNLFQ